MKKKHVFIATFLFICSMIFAINLVTSSFLNKNLFTLVDNARAKQADVKSAGKCTNTAAIDNLNQTNDSQLLSLAQYQRLCNETLPASKMMVFTNMPKDDLDAKNKADAMAKTLQEFNKYHITPIVVVEPETQWGLVDFTEFESGFYDQWIKTYFTELKSKGITNDNIGIWVPFPEANLPYWNRQNAKPADFSAIVNRYLGMLKTQFPKARGSVLLNSATYASDDFDWANGEYVSLVPYVKNLDPKLVDSFGLQGFPWLPPKDGSGNGIFDAREFLNYGLADEAAKSMGVKEIWFNTGTFRSKYAQDKQKQVSVSAEKRKDIINGILNEANKAKSNGYTVWVNIFAQDKSSTAEATDWSYLPKEERSNEDGQVLTYFISKLNEDGVGVSLYDVKK